MKTFAIASTFVFVTTTQVLAQPVAADDAGRSLAAPANLTSGTIAGIAAGETAQGEPRAAVQFVLDASKDLKTGIVSLGWKDGAKNHFLLTFSGPVDTSSNEATPVSLLGLPAGASAKISFNRLMWSGPSGTEQMEIKRLCSDLAQRSISPCQTDNENVPILERTALRQLGHEDATIWFFGGDYTEERTTFRYLVPGSLDSLTENHRGWSVMGRLGLYTPLGFAFGTYSRQSAFAAAGAPAEICRPIRGTDALSCGPAVVGAPTLKELSVGGIELRKFFANSPIAVTPSVQRDFTNKITAVDVPIYFLKATSALTGGVRFNWRSDTEVVTAVVFVGTAIGILPD